MRSPARSVIRWAVKLLVSVLVIAAILSMTQFLSKNIKEFADQSAELIRLREGKDSLEHWIESVARQTSDKLEQLAKASDKTIQARLDAVTQEIRKRESSSTWLLPTAEALLHRVHEKIELRLLRMEQAYLRQLQSARTGGLDLADAKRNLEQKRLEHVAAYQALKQNESERSKLDSDHPIWVRFPGSKEHARLLSLRADYKTLLGNNQRASGSYKAHKMCVQSFGKLSALLPSRDQLESDLHELRDRIAELELTTAESWVGKILQAKTWLPTAFGIVIAAVLTPIAIKAFYYFLIAPLATRRQSICLLPSTDGTIQFAQARGKGDATTQANSAVSQSVALDPTHELLVLPEYLQSTPSQVAKDTKWLLDWRYPISSLVAGAVALTRVRVTSREDIVISTGKADPFSELALLSLPSGAAMVMQPHNLAGLVQCRESPVMITRHWQLFNLNAWLTLQLRYLVFHGPATLIVKGCRGVRVEPAKGDRTINQAVTIGFSANLAYSTTRSEPFAAYLMGEQALFNDRFSGGQGSYVYEEMPHIGKNTGIIARGLEGTTDTILKIFGI